MLLYSRKKKKTRLMSEGSKNVKQYSESTL
jgi:hypothetical protein